MRVAIGADHAGFELKNKVVNYLRGVNHDVLDLGTNSSDPVDYPDYAEAVGLAIKQGRADRGILICGSGVGVSVAANKMVGIRAAVCHDSYSAHQGVEHDDMNVLVLGARVVGTALALDLVATYMVSRFTNEERHVRRLAKVRALESGLQTGSVKNQ
jgi:RpiB/LacA/LacB family sugar-phosphate isomerase